MTKKERNKILELLAAGISETDVTYRYGYLGSIVKQVKRQVDRESSGTTLVWRQMRLFE